MRSVFLIALILLMPVATHAATLQSNDTESITLPPGFGSSTSSDQDGSDSSTIDPGTGTFTAPPTGGDSGGGSSNGTGSNSTDTGTGSITTDPSGTAIITVGSSGTGASGGTSTTTAQVVAALSESGAVTIKEPNSSATSAGSGGSVTISGSKVRSSLAKKGVTALEFNDPSATFSDNLTFTPSDIGLIASAAVLKNQSLQDVTISAAGITITYLQKGYLLWLIPITFTVRIDVNLAPGAPERVVVGYPWYRYITWTDISPVELAADINAAIVGDIATGLTPEAAEAKLFNEITAVLQVNKDADTGSVKQIE